MHKFKNLNEKNRKLKRNKKVQLLINKKERAKKGKIQKILLNFDL